jgi:hypothetical protein
MFDPNDSSNSICDSPYGDKGASKFNGISSKM